MRKTSPINTACNLIKKRKLLNDIRMTSRCVDGPRPNNGPRQIQDKSLELAHKDRKSKPNTKGKMGRRNGRSPLEYIYIYISLSRKQHPKQKSSGMRGRRRMGESAAAAWPLSPPTHVPWVKASRARGSPFQTSNV